VQFRRAASRQAEDEVELGALGNQGVASNTSSQYSPWSYVRDKTGSLIISQVLDSNLTVQYDLNLNTVMDLRPPKLPLKRGLKVKLLSGTTETSHLRVCTGIMKIPS
jgi:hypothetical protein